MTTSLDFSPQVEIAAGKFPFPNWNSIFDQLSEVVNGVAPSLVNNDDINFSDNCLHFVNSWYVSTKFCSDYNNDR